MNYYFRISVFIFCLSCPDEIVPPENFLKFRTDPCEGAYRYTLVTQEDPPDPAGRPAAQRPALTVYCHSGLETRYLRFSDDPSTLYACCREINGRESRIYLCARTSGSLSLDTVFASLFALERRMIGLDSLILHAASVLYQDQAILFTAPSGTGKSTQAGLWEQFRGAKQLNGDRSLLRKNNGAWYACGWPVCGSSKICHNEDAPVRAVVVLSKAPYDRAERLSPAAAFSALYAQVTVNRWDRAFQVRAVDLIQKLIGEVPVFHLSCTVSENAVNCLDAFLQNNTR